MNKLKNYLGALLGRYWSKNESGEVARMSVPDTNAAINVTDSITSPYIAPCNGTFVLGATTAPGGDGKFVGVIVWGAPEVASSNSVAQQATVQTRVQKGKYIYFTTSATRVAKFYPDIGLGV